MTNTTPTAVVARYPPVFEIDDTVTYQGSTYRVADVDGNNRTNCPCHTWCPRLDLRGAGYVRACEVQAALPAAELASTPVRLRARAGRYVVDLQTLAPGVYRVTVENGHGAVVQYDVFDGLALLARSYPREARARAVARNLTVLLRSGLEPGTAASLAL